MMISMRLFTKIISAILIGLMLSLSLSGCQSSYNKKPKKTQVVRNGQKPIKSPHRYKGSFKVGKPYKIKRIKYYPKHYTKYVSTGIASWYGERDGFHGKPTANGDTFDKDMLTAAHKTLPLPSMIEVTNIENGKKALLMVNDRGPFSSKRLLDVSEKAAEILGFKMKGTAKVKVVFLEDETKKLLNKLQLTRVEGSIALQEIINPSCSVDCYLKTVNMKRNILPSSTTTLLASHQDDTYFAKRLDRDATRTSAKEPRVAAKLTLVKEKYTEENPSIFTEEDLPSDSDDKGKGAPVMLKRSGKIVGSVTKEPVEVNPRKTSLTKTPQQKRQIAATEPKIINKGRFYIVAGSYSSLSKAKIALVKVKKYGPTRIARANKIFLIKVGPFDKLTKAKEISTQIKKTTGMNTNIVKNNQKV
jgi:rare lipoprotein A